MISACAQIPWRWSPSRPRAGSAQHLAQCRQHVGQDALMPHIGFHVIAQGNGIRHHPSSASDCTVSPQ